MCRGCSRPERLNHFVIGKAHFVEKLNCFAIGKAQLRWRLGGVVVVVEEWGFV